MLLDKDERAWNPQSAPCRVLTLCTANSARSVMAEAILNHYGKGQFLAVSGGARPSGRVNPLAVECIEAAGLPVAGLRSKSWLEFAEKGSPSLDILLSVCDSAAAEVCPTIPGSWVHVHWGLPDPAGVSDDPVRARQAFQSCFDTLRARVEALLDLPLDEFGVRETAEAMRRVAAQMPA